MAVKFDSINKEHKAFIEAQKMLSSGLHFINVSLKVMDTFKIVDESTVVWPNFAGSGNGASAYIQ